MAIKVISLPSTGIYQRKIRQVAVKEHDPESWKDGISFLKEFHAKRADDPLLPQLRQLEAEANDFLKEYIETDMGGLTETIRTEVASAGFDYVVTIYIDRARQDLEVEFRNRLSEEEKRKLTTQLLRLERAFDACQILLCISIIQNQLECGWGEQAVAHGIALGRAAERFKVRDSERKAWTGDKILRAVSRGGVAAKEAASQRYQQIVAKFRDSGLSQRDFENKYSIKRSTLKRALKKVGPNLSK